jgi:hypothetical protein
LTLANDRAFFEIAQGFAQRLLTEPVSDDRARIRLAFRKALVREPGDPELAGLLGYLDSQRSQFAAVPAEAAKAAPSAVDPAISAAWTMLARVLLNLDEFVTRE